MLHPLDLPQCAEQLYELTELARLTLAFATQSDLTTLPQLDVPKPHYHYRKAVAKETNLAEGSVNRIWAKYIAFMHSKKRETAGNWLLDQYTAVAVPVVELVKIPLVQKQNPDIAQLFAADVALLNQLAKTQDDLSAIPQFHYQAQKIAIDLAVDKLINKLMRNFYEKLFRNSSRPIRTDIVGGTGDLNRNVLLREYSHLYVCPGCDSEHESIQDGQLQTQADHFFPLSRYPFFAVHPLNLVPYCILCNSPLVKGDNDIVTKSNAANLNEIFHPFRPAQKFVEIRVRREPTKVALDITDQGQATPRMTGFLNLLDIQSRWEGEFFQSHNLSRAGNRVFRDLKIAFKSDRRVANHQFQLDNQALFERLQEIVADSQLEYGATPGAMTTKAYAEWIRDDDVERNHLLVRLRQYFQPVPNTTHQQVSQNVQQQGRLAIGIISTV